MCHVILIVNVSDIFALEKNKFIWSGLSRDQLTGEEVHRCRYKGFYTGADTEYPYLVSSEWWRVNLVKLAFILAFEHLVFMVHGVIQYLNRDLPDDVNLHVQRSRQLNRFQNYKVAAFGSTC